MTPQGTAIGLPQAPRTDPGNGPRGPVHLAALQGRRKQREAKAVF